jgi:hypothetical protein
MSKMVVHKYRALFRQATDKLSREGRNHELSAFAAESIASETYNIDSLRPIGSAVPFQLSQAANKSLSKDNSFDNLPLQWAEEGRRPHLDLAKYQQLVGEGERSMGLNGERRHFDPNALLDTFIEQSHYNKHWIENEFDPSSSKPSYVSSAEKPADAPEEVGEGSEEEDSLDESHDYNRVKYASPEEEHETLERRMQEL